MSNTLVATLRNYIPKQVRIATYILIIATFVTITDYAIEAISLDLHKALGAFISLIVANCLILGRAEAFASKNTVSNAVLDAVGMGIGFTLALVLMLSGQLDEAQRAEVGEFLQALDDHADERWHESHSRC